MTLLDFIELFVLGAFGALIVIGISIAIFWLFIKE